MTLQPTLLPETTDIAGEQLEAAFQMFNQMSQELTQSYGELEAQASQLAGELAEARTERVKQLAEKEMLASRLEALLNALPAAVIVLDEDNRVSQFNARATAMFGLNIQAQAWQVIAEENFIRGVDGIQLRDGCWVNISTRALQQYVAQTQATQTRENKSGGKIILVTDVTEIHQLEASLNHQKRLTALGEMVAGLAHQIRTPLSSALLYLSNINHPNAKSSDRQRYTDKASESLKHLERMVSDMLIFARGGVSENERFTIGQLMKSFKHLLEPVFVEKKALLLIDNKVPDMYLFGNSDSLLSAFHNLANNALEAREQDCPRGQNRDLIFNVSITALSDEAVEFCFQDNACGMSDEIKSRVLEPFFTTRNSGTGLGLAVLNETVLSHQGVLNIQSQQGQGSCFTITLPVGIGHTVLNSEITQSVDELAIETKQINNCSPTRNRAAENSTNVNNDSAEKLNEVLV